MRHEFSKICLSLIAASETRPCRRKISFSAAFLRPFLLLLFLLFPALLLGCDSPGGSGGGPAPPSPAPPSPAPPKGLQDILQSGTLPPRSELAAYDKVTADILENLAGDAPKKLGIIYVTPDGGAAKDGRDWKNAHEAANLQTAIDNAAGSEQKPYLVLLAKGSYAISETLSMKDHVAIIGGFSGNGGNREGQTTLDGRDSSGNIKGTQIFSNTDLHETAVLSGVNISYGDAATKGGGMYNDNSSPTLSYITFSGNTADEGGGMYNDNNSFPTLSHITFSENEALRNNDGGGMYNNKSSPTLINVTFAWNEADNDGGGMYNNDSSPTLINVTFSGNEANNNGGGMNNNDSSPTLINVTFSGNTIHRGVGGGMWSSGDKKPLVFNSIFWGNTPDQIAQFNNLSLKVPFSDMNIFYSIVKDITANPDRGLSARNPQLGALKDNGGFVQTMALPAGSPAINPPINKGAYIQVQRSSRDFYHSTDNIRWHLGDSLSTVPLPPEAIDLTALDARGYARTRRPDLGAFESGAQPRSSTGLGVISFRGD